MDTPVVSFAGSAKGWYNTILRIWAPVRVNRYCANATVCGSDTSSKLVHCIPERNGGKDLASRAMKSLEAEFYNDLGNRYSIQGLYQQAIDLYTRAISLDPQLAEAHYNRGLAYDNLGQYQNAIHEYKVAIGLNPGNVPAHNNLGRLYVKEGECELAIEILRKGLEMDPQNIGLHQNLATAHRRLGHQDEFQAHIDEFYELLYADRFEAANEDLD
jgi:tetratricopeptide (TPR) repeat protein